ncbi:MAG: hypothetical protein J5879_05625 [Clostridia bacterium]|nr:hypothetical protein [Clostridia bacterium]
MKIRSALKQITAVIIIIAMMPFAAITANADTLEQDENGYFLIDTARKLQQFADIVNSGNTTACAKLTESINMWQINYWILIGCDPQCAFNGTFDGNHEEIYFFTCEQDADCTGIFGYTGENSVIKNIDISFDVTISGGSCVGGIVGHNKGVISDCGFGGTVSASGDYAGGIAGYNEGQIIDCSNDGEISGGSYIGGIAGYSTGEIKNSKVSSYSNVSGSSNVGGVAGYSSANIENCYNKSTVTGNGTDAMKIGGIAGESTGNIENNYNTGTVTGGSKVGGIAGESAGKIENSYNTGTVTGGSRAGGIAGYSSGNIINCYNTAAINGGNRNSGGISGEFNGKRIEYCYNTGNVDSLTGAGGIVGAVSETNTSAVITSCFNAGPVSGYNGTGGIAGYNYYGTVIGCYNAGTVTARSGMSGGIAGVSKGTVKICYNTGKVEAVQYVGGIVGLNDYGDVKSCYNTAAVEGKNYVGGIAGMHNVSGPNSKEITDCYNIGSVLNDYLAGGIAGYIFGGKVQNCYYKKDVCNAAYAGGTESTVTNVKALFETQMTGAEALSAMKMSDSSVWMTKADGIGIEGADYYFYYPHLKGFNFKDESGKRVEFPMGIDESCQQTEASDIIASAWPPKTEVVVTYSDAGPFTYNGNDQRPRVAEVKAGDVVLEPVTDYTVSINNSEVFVEHSINAGKYKLLVTIGSHAPIEKEYKILKMPLTVTADSAMKEYDGTPLTKGTYTNTALAEGDSIERVTVTGSLTTVGLKENVPSAAKIVNSAGENVTSSYEITYKKGSLVVTKMHLTVTADSDAKIYDGTPLTKGAYTNTPLAEGDSIESVTVTGSQITVGSSENEPSAAKIVNSTGADVTSSYEITYRNGTLQVTKMHLTVTAGSDAKVYDGTPLTNSSFTYTTLAEGDSITGIEIIGSQTGVGSSENEPSAAKIVNSAGEDVTSSYEITYHNGTLEVTKRHVTITADSATKVYDGTPLTKGTYTNTALAEGDSIESLTVSGSQTVFGSGNNVPSAAKIVDSKGKDVTNNYDITYVSGTLEVTRRTVTVTADGGTKVYDGTPLTSDTAACDDLAEGDVIASVEITGSQTDAGASDAVLQSVRIENAAGDDVTASYGITYANGTLTVTAKPITITAASDSKICDDTPLENGNYTNTELAEGDSIESVKVEGSLTEPGSAENVPSEAKIVNAAGDDVTANYEITYENGTLTVTDKRKLTITAADGEKVYDGSELTNGSYTITALAEGDSLESLTVTGSQTDAGSCDNVPGAAKIVDANGNDVTATYDITYENGTLTVTRAKVTVKADDKSKVYGEDDPKFTATVSGLVNGDDESVITYNITRAEGANVGEYDITPAGEAEQGNYEVTYEAGKLTVNAKSSGWEELPDDCRPKAKELTENGEEQALIEAPASTPDGYTVQYSTDDGKTWTEDIPTGKDPGEYGVNVRYAGDENHDDFGGETLTSRIKAVYTVIWKNGDGSELDRKTYVEGEEEPVTDKVPVKEEDAGNTYRFKAWSVGETGDKVKTYEPEFTAVPKEAIVPATGDGDVVCWAFVSCAALLGMIFIPVCCRKRAKYR